MEDDVCRVAVHSGGTQVDVELPTAVPIALLLPPLFEIVGGDPGASTRPLHLCPPAGPPLDTSKTLLQNGIRDGDTLILTAAPVAPPSPPALDAAQHLARSATATRRDWGGGESRAAALLITAALAGAAGVLAVPGPPGPPHLLLAAAASGAVAGIAAQVAGSGRTALLAQAFGCALIVAAALGTSLFGGDTYRIGPPLTAAATAVLVSAGRLTAMLCGLSGCATRDLQSDLDPAPPSFAGSYLTGLVLAAAGTATIGLLLTLARPSGADCALALATTAALLLRARAQPGVAHRIALLIAGTACAVATLVAIRELDGGFAPWLLAVTATASAAALWYAYRSAPQLSPVAGRVATVIECGALAAILPLACWALGLYDAVRAVRLS